MTFDPGHSVLQPSGHDTLLHRVHEKVLITSLQAASFPAHSVKQLINQLMEQNILLP